MEGRECGEPIRCLLRLPDLAEVFLSAKTDFLFVETILCDFTGFDLLSLSIVRL